MIEAGIIQHASESAKQKLVEGFIIFCFIPKSSWAEKTDGEFEISFQILARAHYPLLSCISYHFYSGVFVIYS